MENPTHDPVAVEPQNLAVTPIVCQGCSPGKMDPKLIVADCVVMAFTAQGIDGRLACILLDAQECDDLIAMVKEARDEVFGRGSGLIIAP